MSSNSKASIHEYANEILEKWVNAVAAHNSLLGKEDAVREQFAGWLAILDQSDRQERIEELYQLLAIHSRNQALHGRPLSSVMRQVLCLRETLINHFTTLAPGLSQTLDTLLLVVGDGYALGQSQNIRQQWVQRAKDGVPVFRYRDRTVLSFIAYPNFIEVVDVAYGRALKLVQMHQAEFLVFDLLCEQPLSRRFIETTKSLSQMRELENTELIFTGLASDSDDAKTLISFPKTRVFDELEEYLATAE